MRNQISKKVLKIASKNFFDVRESKRMWILLVEIPYIMKICTVCNGNIFKNFVPHLHP